ncbi:MAG: hypothetical protein U0361_19795 [Nitrospiraceae bacterium]
MEALRLAAKVLGDHGRLCERGGLLHVVDGLLHPFTLFKGSWLYTTMGSAPAGAQGVRDALDVLIAKGRLPKEEDLKVVVPGAMDRPMIWRSPPCPVPCIGG